MTGVIELTPNEILSPGIFCYKMQVDTLFEFANKLLHQVNHVYVELSTSHMNTIFSTAKIQNIMNYNTQLPQQLL